MQHAARRASRPHGSTPAWQHAGTPDSSARIKKNTKLAARRAQVAAGRVPHLDASREGRDHAGGSRRQRGKTPDAPPARSAASSPRRCGGGSTAHLKHNLGAAPDRVDAAAAARVCSRWPGGAVHHHRPHRHVSEVFHLSVAHSHFTCCHSSNSAPALSLIRATRPASWAHRGRVRAQAACGTSCVAVSGTPEYEQESTPNVDMELPMAACRGRGAVTGRVCASAEGAGRHAPRAGSR